MKFNLVVVDQCNFISTKSATFNRDGQSVTCDYIAVVMGDPSCSDVGNIMCTSAVATAINKLSRFTNVKLYGVFDTYKKEFVVTTFDDLTEK